MTSNLSGLELRQVTVSLLGRDVVSDVNLTVPAGSWVTLVGPNGAGKSTLLRAVTGAVEHEGEVTFDGVPITNLRARERARTVAVVPQAPARPTGMTVLDYVLLGRTPYIPYFGVESETDIDVTHQLLATLELVDLAGRAVTSLSGGEFQRAVLARALAQQAPLLLLDEPTSSLDLGHAQQVLDLVDELRVERGLTVVSALHELTTAGQFADRLVLLVDGRVAANGRPGDVLTEELISAHYGAKVRVMADPDGGVVVVPLRDRAVRPSGESLECRDGLESREGVA